MLLPLRGRGTTANCAIRCGTWSIVQGVRCRIVTDKIVDGRGHGNLLDGRTLEPSATAFTWLWRKNPLAGGVWEQVEQLDSNSFGHWTTVSLPEFYDYVGASPRRWTYGIGDTADEVKELNDDGYSYTREYIAGVFSLGAGLCVFEQLPNFVYVVYARNGIKHIYNAPPDYWFENQKTQAHYDLPRTDTTEQDSSPSGYVDGNGTIRLYVLRSGDLVRLDSVNWGLIWSAAVATPISADQAFEWPSRDGTNQFSVYVAGGIFTFASSHDHFDSVDEDFTIATGVDDKQVSGYHGPDGHVYAYAFVDGVLTCWESETRGRTWTERGTA